ncbi:hypothetical protein L917_07329, partial [Phytophthora nicotianae]
MALLRIPFCHQYGFAFFMNEPLHHVTANRVRFSSAQPKKGFCEAKPARKNTPSSKCCAWQRLLESLWLNVNGDAAESFSMEIQHLVLRGASWRTIQLLPCVSQSCCTRVNVLGQKSFGAFHIKNQQITNDEDMA